MVKTQGVVHFSLPVTDLERSAKFYSELLGMKIVQKAPRMVFLKSLRDLFPAPWGVKCSRERVYS